MDYVGLQIGKTLSLLFTQLQSNYFNHNNEVHYYYYMMSNLVYLTCKNVHSPSYVFSLAAKQCTYPQSPSNGEMYYEDNMYKSTINYTCHEG